MKRLLAFLVLSAITSVAQLSIRNHGLGNGCGGTTCLSNSSFTAISGDSMFVLCGAGSGITINTPTDPAGNTYTTITGPTTHGGSKDQTWRVDHMVGFVNGKITCNFGASTGAEQRFIEVANTGRLDASATDKTYAATASPWPSNALTTSGQNEIVITCADNDSVAHTYTAPAGFTISDADTNTACAYQIVAAIQSSATYSWTGTGAADNLYVFATSFTSALVGKRALLLF